MVNLKTQIIAPKIKPKRILNSIRSGKIDYREVLGLPSKEDGSNLSVLFIGTGLPTHKEFKNMSDFENFTDDTTVFDDVFNTVTLHAGILAADGDSIKGILPKAKFACARITDDKGEGVTSSLIASLIWAAVKGFDIAVITIPIVDNLPTLHVVAKMAYDNNVCVFANCSKTDNVDLGNYFPKIGCVDYELSDEFSIQKKTKKLLVSLEKTELFSTNKQNQYAVVPNQVSSLSIAAGLAGIAIQKLKEENKKYTPSDVYSEMTKLFKAKK